MPLADSCTAANSIAIPSPRRRARRSKMGECRDEQKKGRDRRDETVNAECVDGGDLQVHEIDREARAQDGVGKRRETQPARKRIERKQRRQAEHVQVVDDSEIPYRQIVNARIRAVRDLVASIDGRRTPRA